MVDEGEKNNRENRESREKKGRVEVEGFLFAPVAFFAVQFLEIDFQQVSGNVRVRKDRTSKFQVDRVGTRVTGFEVGEIKGAHFSIFGECRHLGRMAVPCFECPFALFVSEIAFVDKHRRPVNKVRIGVINGCIGNVGQRFVWPVDPKT